MEELRTVYHYSKRYIARNKWKTACVVLAMVLAYGFYVTTYTLNIDDVFTSFWNGGRLIAAGRFTGYLVQFITGFMTYSPFFTMFLALCVFFVAGLVLMSVIALSAEEKISDGALFVFWIVFVTYPLISEQMVYPIILLLSLGYFLIALSVFCLVNFFQTRSFGLLLAAMVMMVLSIDFYEAFASVFLTVSVMVLLAKYLFAFDKKDCKQSSLLLLLAKMTAALLAAILIRYAVSKLALFLYYGTMQAGYSGNSMIYWSQLGLLDGLIWLLRTTFLRYFWAGIDYFPIFIFVVSAIVSVIFASVQSVRKRSVVPIAAILLMIVAALSLNVVLGLATNYTMAQALGVFVAFVMMWLFSAAEKKKISRMILTVLLVLLVINQAKCLNRWSVTNFERYDYEMTVVDDIGDELTENFNTAEKPVVFIGADHAPHLPDSIVEQYEVEHPAVLLFQEMAVNISDRILPKRFYKSIGGFYNEDIQNASDLLAYVKHIRNRSSSVDSYLSWASGGYDSWFSPFEPNGVSDELFALFKRRGFELRQCSREDFDKYKDQFDRRTAYPKNGYIVEEDDCIVVNFGV